MRLPWLVVVGCLCACRGLGQGARSEPPPAADVVARLDPEGFAVPRVDAELRRRSPGLADVGPRPAKGAKASESAQPYVHFAQPMRTDGPVPTFELDPPVEGEAVWIDPYRAWFMPSEPLKLAQRYRVRVSGKPQTATGEPLAIAESWELVTRPPFVELEVHESYGWSWGDEEERRDRHWLTPVVVRSELRIAAKHLMPHLRARAWKTGTDPRRAVAVPLRVLDDGDLDPLPDGTEDLRGELRIYPRTRWPAGSHVVVELDPAFAPPGAGPIGAAVRAELDVTDGLHARTDCYEDFGDGCGPMGFMVEFDGDVDPKMIRHITVEPRPKALAVEEHWNGASITGGFLPNRRYRVRLGTAIRDRYGQGIAGARSIEVRIVPPPPTVELVAGAGIVRPELAPTIGLEARWVRRALLRAAVPSERTWAALAGRDLADVPFPTEVDHLLEREIDLAPRGRWAWSSLAVDLAELAHGQPRPVLVEVVPLEVLPSARKRPRPEVARGLYQLSGLGAAAWLSHGEARVQVRGLASLEPVKGASIDVVAPDGRVVHSARTDASGMAELPHDRALPPESYLVAKTDRDRLLVRVGREKPREPEEDRGWYGDRGEDRMLSSVVTERAIYRPGELVSIVGWAAISTPRTNHGLARPKQGTAVELELLDPRGEVAIRRTVKMAAHGKYWARLALRDDVPLGSWRAVAKIGDDEFTARFEVRDVRLPEFEVQAAAVASELHRGDTAEIVAHANYYFGGTVKIGKSRASTRCRPRWSLPPGIEPGWSSIGLADETAYQGAARSLPGDSRTTADGEARVDVRTDVLLAGIGHDCDTELAIQDAAFGEVGAAAGWSVHPSSYLLVHEKRLAADQQVMHVRAVDHRGKRHDGPEVQIEVSRIERVERKDGRVEERLTRVHHCRLAPTARADASCKTPKLAPGHYRAELSTTVDGAALAWRDDWWAHEPQKPRPRTSSPSLTITVDDTEPEPGQTLRVELDGPTGTNHGMLAVSHLGLRELVPFRLVDGRATIELPVTDAWIPDVTLHGFLLVPGARPKDRPRTFTDEQRITVGHESRALQVAIEAAEVARSGSELPITVRVADRKGKPVAGRVAIWAVDEALHSLVSPHIPDFVRTFAVGRWLPTRWMETYSSVLEPYEPVDDPFALGLGGIGLGGGGGTGSGRGGGSVKGALAQPTARQKFEGTPIFVADAVVGRDGIARIRGRLPDNLTTFRLTAIASADVASGPGVGRFGHTDARVRVTAPLVVRAALPRMLRPGDEAEAAAIVDNLGGPAGKVAVEIALVDAKGRLELVEAPKGSVPIDAGGQVRVPFRVRARGTGVAHVEARATLATRGADLVDAVRLPLPIERATDLQRHAAVYGSSAQDGSFAVALTRPRDLDGRKVDVEVALSGSMLAGLEDMAADLAQYPYGCVEQTSSGLLPLAALGGLQRAGFLTTDVDSHVAAGIARLRSMQVDGGGLGYWPGARHPNAWGTAYALWVLEQLRANGHEVPASLRTGMRDWLADRVGLQRAPADDADAEVDPDEAVTERFDDLTAVIAVQALVAAGERPTAALAQLHERRHALPVFARALLLLAAHEADSRSTIARELRDELLRQIDERQGVASVGPGETFYDEVFDSQTRTEAMVLLALLRTAPADPRVEKLMRNLSQLRVSGHIANTQERAYALLAFADWARRNEPNAADLHAELWVGERPVRDVALRGRAAGAAVRRGELQVAPRGDVGRVTMRRSGEGRMYWRVGMTWTPKDAGRRPSAHGIALERTLRDERGAVRDDSLQAGELVAMDVTIRVDAATRWIAVDLPLPPGLETVDITLGKGQRARRLAGGRGGWVSHEELRRDRAVLFADALGPGTHETTVFLRATTPGRYEMPPAVAHAMYTPEIRGHTTRTSVRIAAPPK